MTKLTLSVVLAAVAALTFGVKVVDASGSAPSGTSAVTAKSRINNAVTDGHPLDKSAKGAKVFGADTTATLVTDEALNAPTFGGLASLSIGTIGANPLLSGCYLMVFDSAVASDTTEANSVSRMMVPPFQAVTSSNQSVEFIYPKQFHKGLVVLVGGTGAANCVAKIGWVKNGGSN